MGATGTRLSLRPLFSERAERHARLGHVVPRGWWLAPRAVWNV